MLQSMLQSKRFDAPARRAYAPRAEHERAWDVSMPHKLREIWGS